MQRSRIYKTEAIILKQIPIGEADRIFTLFTANLGKIKAVAKGVRKPKSRIGGHLEPLSHCSLMIARGRNLDIISSAETLNSFPKVKEHFEDFFNHSENFTLGVCNGCQMLSQLKDIIPGAGHWPHFVKNLSEQFEARLSLVEITKSSSLFLRGMEGSMLPIATSHGEGRTQYHRRNDIQILDEHNQISLRYVDNYGRPSAVSYTHLTLPTILLV